MKRVVSGLTAAFFMLSSSAAFAGADTSYTITQGQGTSVSAFLCFSTMLCPKSVQVDNNGVEKGTASNPQRIDPTGTTTQPVSGTLLMQGFVTPTAPTYGTTGPANVSIDGQGNLRTIVPSSQLLTSGSTGPGTDPGQGIAVLCQNGGVPTVNTGQTVAFQCGPNGVLLTSSGTVNQGTTTAGQAGILGQAAVVSGAQSFTPGQTNPLTQTAQGYLNVNVAGGSAGNGAASNVGATPPTQADFQGLKFGATLQGWTAVQPSGSIIAGQIDIASVNGITVPTGHGVAANTVRVELPSDGTGQVGISPSQNGVSAVLTTAGGWTPQKVAALGNSPVLVKGAAGQLGMLYCYNGNSSQVFVQVFNNAAPTVGTTASFPFGIPANSNGGFPMSFPGIEFTTAISVAATTLATNSTNPASPIDCTVASN